MTSLLREDKPWEQTAGPDGLLNPNSYSATAVFGIVEMAVELLHAAGVQLGPTVVTNVYGSTEPLGTRPPVGLWLPAGATHAQRHDSASSQSAASALALAARSDSDRQGGRCVCCTLMPCPWRGVPKADRIDCGLA